MMIQAHPKIQATPLDLDLSDTHVSPSLGLLGSLDTHVTIDPSSPGKQHGHLVLPYTGTQGGFGHLRVPVSSIRGPKPGPTVALLGGVHGDEYEGALTLKRLATEISTAEIHGCLLLIPSLNVLGSALGSRIAPLDGRDLDTCFPGSPSGSISERLAYEIFERMLRPADLILDLRSGGSALNVAPTAAVRFMGVLQRSTGDQQQRSEAAMIAFGAPNSVRLPASNSQNCLAATCEAAGKPYVQTELGGSGSCSAETLTVAKTGCLNVLRHMGVLQQEIQLRHSRIMEVRDSSFFVHAEAAGLLEPHARLGHEVWQGDPLASLVDMSDVGSLPKRVEVPRNGVLLAMHKGGPVKPGELLAILADEVHH